MKFGQQSISRLVLHALIATTSLLAGCTSAIRSNEEAPNNVVVSAPLEPSGQWAVQSAAGLTQADLRSAPTWQHFKLPGKRASEFEYDRKDGRDALAVQSNSSASMLRLPLQIAAADLGYLRFSWYVPELIPQADLALRDTDDSPVRVVLAFEGDRSKFSTKNALLSELARAVTGEEIPYATLMYVWCNERPAGSIVVNSRTDRVRKLVVQSGAAQIDQWLDYERDVRGDYMRVFGEAPGALVGIAIMTDTDNTQSSAKAWYGPMSFSPKTPAKTLLNQ
jgi:hypothetical protein